MGLFDALKKQSETALSPTGFFLKIIHITMNFKSGS